MLKYYNHNYAGELDDGTFGSPRVPRTPNSPGCSSGRGSGTSLNKILDQRRHLVMQLFTEHGMFPSSKARMFYYYSCCSDAVF